MPKKKQNEKSLFVRCEQFFHSKSGLFLIISVSLSLIISILIFNRDVSNGGDDSGYIKMAYMFSHGVSFPSWHSSFYSIILSFFVSIFGVNIIILKCTSLIFNLLSIYFLYRFFIKYTNYTTAVFVVISTSISYLTCYYSSTTYTESFFTLVQIMYIFYFLEFTHKYDDPKESLRKTWIQFLVLGIVVYLMFQTKTIALSIFIISIAYLILNKKLFNSLIYFLSALFTHFSFSIYKSLFWSLKKVGFEEQLETVLMKNPYKPEDGAENLMGFVIRIWDNSKLYFSKDFVKMLGFIPQDYRKTNAFLTIILYLIFFISGIFFIKKNKKLLYIVLYLIAMIGSTFIFLQKIWDQDRLIMIYFPFLIGIVAFYLFNLFDKQKLKKLQFIPITLFGIIIISMSLQTIKQINKKDNINKNNKEAFNSYTPDWQNYMLACKWAGENLPSNSVVLCRKPDMSWLASEGKDIFVGIYRIEYNNSDSVLAMVKRLKATHVILENFRVNPDKKTENTINTIRNTLIYLNGVRPACLKTIKEFGTDEKAYIFEINIKDKLSDEEYYQNLDAALIVNPKNSKFCDEKGRYLLSHKKPQEALKYYDFALNYSKKEPALFFYRGLCYYEMGKFSEASSNFKKACEFKPDFNQSWFDLALCYYMLKDYGNSRAALVKAKETGFKDFAQFENQLNRAN
jgi:hypothetical protein